MNHRIVSGLLIMAAGLVVLPGFGRAEMLEINKMASGFVQSAGPSSVTIQNQPSGLLSRINVNAQTQYEGVKKHTELHPGDKVNIEYNEENHKKTAAVITKPEPGY